MVCRSNQRTTLNWRKSSASTDADECVEVAASGPSVLVRDSHDHSAGVLSLAAAEWAALLTTIRNGDLDHP